MTGLLGGTFDPPHSGHVELARRARERFELDELVVLVSALPGHKHAYLDAETRLRLARVAFPDEDVRIDEHARTVDTLRAGSWREPLFLIGADQFCDFLDWKDPEAILRLARLGVATRPGYSREQIDAVLARVSQPERVIVFEIEPLPVSSREVRVRAAAGERIGDLVPSAVGALIEELGLYRGYTVADRKDLTTR